MSLIDSHSHIYLEQFDEDLEDAMGRARKMGIDQILMPNIDSGTIDRMNGLVSKYPGMCKPMLGLHPCSVKEGYRKELEIIEAGLRAGDYIAVGEIGIDLYWDKTTLDIQIEAFAFQIELAKELALPIVIHARDSFDEIFAVVDEMNDERLRGVFHCFTGSNEQAQKVIDYGGFKMGIGGVLTYKNAGLDKTMEHIDPMHIIVETDAPYLSPVPYRGKRNEPSYVVEVVKKLAEVWSLPYDDVCAITTANTKELFGL